MTDDEISAASDAERRPQRPAVRMTPARLLGAGAVLAGALVLIAAFPGILDPRSGGSPRTVADTESASDEAPVPPALSARVFEVILPSLVLIETERTPGADGTERFGVGTGVVVNQDGSILTANHVIDGATAIRVTFADGTQAGASVVSSDPENDIATLLPDRLPEVLVPATLGSLRRMQAGDEAYAVGNPLGLTASISAGVISGFNRSIPIPGSNLNLEGLIQFDAAVNPGSSGGPLLNREGQVIGIVTALANPTNESFFSGIGFAVPIGTAAGGGGGGPSQ